MGIGGGIEDLLATALGAQDARRPQQPQMVAHERGREPEPAGDLADGHRRGEAGEDDPQPARIAHHAKHLGEHGGVVLGQAEAAEPRGEIVIVR